MMNNQPIPNKTIAKEYYNNEAKWKTSSWNKEVSNILNETFKTFDNSISNIINEYLEIKNLNKYNAVIYELDLEIGEWEWDVSCGGSLTFSQYEYYTYGDDTVY